MTWNKSPRVFLWLKLLMLTKILRDRHGYGMALIAVIWLHRIRISVPSKMAGPPKEFPKFIYSFPVC